MGRCDEVEELIPDIHCPVFVGEDSVCLPHQLCPKCGQARYGDFRVATETELRGAGLQPREYRKWGT